AACIRPGGGGSQRRRALRRRRAADDRRTNAAGTGECRASRTHRRPPAPSALGRRLFARHRVYNVNADQMAVSCAADWGAERLLFLTDVPGVKNGDGDILPELTVAESRALVASGAAHGGMQAKLEAAEAGLRQGIGEVCIAPGRETDICARL